MSERQTLLVELGKKLKLIAKELWLKHGEVSSCISPALDQVLMVVGSEGQINVKHLATLLRITPGAVTQHIDALEKAGMLARVMNKTDRREVMVSLTRKGRGPLKQIRKANLELLDEAFRNLDDGELATFVELITKVSAKYVNKEQTR